MSADTTASPTVHESAEDYRDHERTYHSFVRGVVIVAAHCLVILILMAIFLL
jgi:hypothetical protein